MNSHMISTVYKRYYKSSEKTNNPIVRLFNFCSGPLLLMIIDVHLQGLCCLSFTTLITRKLNTYLLCINYLLQSIFLFTSLHVNALLLLSWVELGTRRSRTGPVGLCPGCLQQGCWACAQLLSSSDVWFQLFLDMTAFLSTVYSF